MSDADRNKKLALGGLGAAAACAVGYFIYKSYSKKPAEDEKKVETVDKPKKSKKKKEAKNDKKAAAPEKKAEESKSVEIPIEDLTGFDKKKLCNMFEEMIEHMSAFLYQLTMQLHALQEQNKTEEEVNTFFQTQYVQGIEGIHKMLLTKYKV